MNATLAQPVAAPASDWRERISYDPRRCGGRPCVRGLRIRVLDVLQMLASGMSREEILHEYPDLEDGDIDASLNFAIERVDHPRGAALICWLDFHLPHRLPGLIRPILDALDITMFSMRELFDEDVNDIAIFRAAAVAGAVLITKDADFGEMQRWITPRPQVVWLRCGNISNPALAALMTSTLLDVVYLLEQGEPLVEIEGHGT